MTLLLLWVFWHEPFVPGGDFGMSFLFLKAHDGVNPELRTWVTQRLLHVDLNHSGDTLASALVKSLELVFLGLSGIIDFHLRYSHEQ